MGFACHANPPVLLKYLRSLLFEKAITDLIVAGWLVRLGGSRVTARLLAAFNYIETGGQVVECKIRKLNSFYADVLKL